MLLALQLAACAPLVMVTGMGAEPPPPPPEVPKIISGEAAKRRKKGKAVSAAHLALSMRGLHLDTDGAVKPALPPGPPPQAPPTTAHEGGSSSSSSWTRVGNTPGARPKASATQHAPASPSAPVAAEAGAGDEADAVADASKTKGGKRNQQCMSCHGMVMASELLLLTDTADWCERLWGHCFSCSTYNSPACENPKEKEKSQKAFAKAAKTLWVKRSYDYCGRVQKAKQITWNNAMEYIRQALPGAKYEVQRQLTLMRVRSMAATAFLDVMQSSVHHRAAIVTLQDRYIGALEKAAADPMSSCTIELGTLSRDERSYLTRVTKNLMICFVCRHPECAFFGANDESTWIKSSTSSHWRCPRCGLRYQPWADKLGKSQREALPFNKCIVYTDVHQNGRQTVVPCCWPSTAEDDFLGIQAEIYARDITTPKDLDGFYNKNAVDMSSLLERSGQHIEGFQNFQLSGDALWHLSTATGFGPEQRTVQQSKGFIGLVMTPEQKKMTPFTDFSALISLMANLIKAGESMAAEVTST